MLPSLVPLPLLAMRMSTEFFLMIVLSFVPAQGTQRHAIILKDKSFPQKTITTQKRKPNDHLLWRLH